MSEQPRTHESPYGGSIANGMTEEGLQQSRTQEIDHRRELLRRRKWLEAQLESVKAQIDHSQSRTEIYRLALHEIRDRKVKR